MEPIIIGIAGGSGSGKSTFTNRLRQYFGDDVVVIYHDNYYRRQDGIPFEQRVKVNYDHPDSLETDLLVEHLKELKAGKTIECPVYDYSPRRRGARPRPEGNHHPVLNNRKTHALHLCRAHEGSR